LISSNKAIPSNVTRKSLLIFFAQRSSLFGKRCSREGGDRPRERVSWRRQDFMGFYETKKVEDANGI
jgi:hypothetical protein